MDFKRAFFKSIRPLVGVTYKPLLKRYLSKPTKYNYEGINLIISKGVFHPRFFFSTKLFLAFLKNQELKNRNFLEIGVGSGLLSIYAAKKGAKVKACDISETAVINSEHNAILNNVDLELCQSNMFDKITPQIFDVIVVAPPYYKKNPISEADHAWYCGQNMEYFTKFFTQIRNYSNEKTKIWMILSDDCDLDGIASIAKSNHKDMQVVYQKTKYWEINYIYEIRPI